MCEPIGYRYKSLEIRVIDYEKGIMFGKVIR